ncbi:hypothetical protein OA667_02660 [Prochlorococcus sp. AH-716-G10]|nr:hypothetical protein [Prochlorococcus sp. AH-716-G10]
MTVDLIICRTCKKELSNENFYWRDVGKSSQRHHLDCKTCTKKKQKEKNDILKKRTIEEAVTKIEKRCNQCKQILKVKEFGIALTNPDGLKTICKPCESKRSIAWSNSTPERRETKLARNKAWFQNNREQHYLTAKKWKENNPEKVKEVQKKSTKKYLASEKGKENLAKIRRIRTESGKGAAYKRARDAQKRNATPPWQDLEALFPIYEEASILENINGLEYEVDHIDPLKNKLVCGLHVLANLQAIPKSNNRAKHNKFIPYRIDLNEEIWELKGKVWIKKES